MTFVQLGFLEFIQEILSALFNDVFAPILSKVLMAIFKILWSMVVSFMSSFLLTGFTMWLSILDYIASVYDVLTGVSTVTYGNETGLTMIQALFKVNAVGKAFIVMTVAAIVLAFAFSMLSVIRSMQDTVLENKHPISEVLRWSLKSALSFAMIPLLCVFMLQFTQVIFSTIGEINYTDTSGGNHSVEIVGSTPGDVLFVTMIQDAIVVPEEYDNDTQRAGYIQQRLDYYLTELGDVAANQFSYRNTDQVLEDVNAAKVNYFVAFISVGCLLILMLMSAITLVRRMFELLILYIVAPFFAATIALDGGAVFKKWKNMFIGKFFAGAGTMIAMKIFLMILPMVATSRFAYSEDKLLNQIITILFVLGGAWAVYNASITFGKVMDPDSAQEEEGQRRDTISFVKGRWSKLSQGSQNNQSQNQNSVPGQGGSGSSQGGSGGGPQGPVRR